ncbi:MAG: MFS transporter [Planctomycetes bacterium]|nr:MFS transporter [Planctomycetota bacterium]
MKDEVQADSGPWFRGITSYQWLVLLIASLGWVFDVFEGQIFVASMNEAMPSLIDRAALALREGISDPDVLEERYKAIVAYYNNIALAAFLLGGALGGVVFGMVSDRIGRTKTMILTILVYSGFTCVTAFAQTWWQMSILRFLVAMGVGGEWAVASAMVAEVFPARARAWSGAIFHGSSVFGTYLAIAAGEFIVGDPDLGWRWGFVVGALPAFLTLWIRWRLREPDKWLQARDAAAKDPRQRTGNLAELFQGRLLGRTLLGVSLAAIGLATFWGVHIYGKDLMRQRAEVRFLAQENVLPEADAQTRAAALKPHQESIKSWEMLGMLLVTTGGGLGLFCFGPICEWLGRRGAFAVYHLGGLITALMLFQWLADADASLYFFLPLFGFLTLGMHAGYAIYFPELYPTRLRGTGAGFCFNFARLVTALMLFINGWLRERGISLEDSASLLSFLFLLGVALMAVAPETKGRELPE